MAPVIWGLDLSEMQWYKFKSSYMFGNTDWHLRRTKFVVYQLALILCVISESLGTDVLSDYIQMERKIQGITANKVKVYNNNYVGAASYNIGAGVFVAFIFGAAFFFDLFWPMRKENKLVRIAWKTCGILSVFLYTASAIWLTYITATKRSIIVPHIAPFNERYWWRKYSKHSEAPLVYKENVRAVCAYAFAWAGWCAVVPSCILLFLSIDNAEFGPGPKSAHARERDAINGNGNEDPEKAAADLDSSPGLAHPDPTRDPRTATAAAQAATSNR